MIGVKEVMILVVKFRMGKELGFFNMEIVVGFLFFIIMFVVVEGILGGEIMNINVEINYYVWFLI